MIVVDLLTKYISPFQAALLTSLFLLYFVYLYLKDYNLPPGPIGLPILGFWPFLNAETCHIQLKDMVRKYGEVFSFRVTGRLFIHLGSIKTIKEAHLTKSDCFGERFSGYNLLSVNFQEGLSIINGEPWKVLRKFFLSKFKEYGMNTVKEHNKGSINYVLNETIEELLRTKKDQPIAIANLATAKCALLIRRILFNFRGITSEELQKLIVQFNIITNAMKSTNFLLFGNLTKYLIFPLMPCYWRMKKASKCIDDILFSVIDRHKKEYDETEISDIIDCFIKEREDRRLRGGPTANYFTDKALVSTLNQFLVDGILTVGLFIGNFLISLIEHPEEQDKIYRELLEVTGPERLPMIEDKPNLPYTNAFIYEVMRLSNLFPIFPSQQCTKETTIQGYRIPEGAITYINLHAAHRNPESFYEPEKFNPSRYLMTSNTSRAELPIMFGVGKRSCIGEGFAMIQAFLFVTAIVKNFRLFVRDGKTSFATLWSQDELYIYAVPRSQKEQS